MMDMVERVAKAIDEVQLWSRFNDWTSDRVPGLPIEICRYGKEDEDEIVVVERFGGAITEAEALADTVSMARARAAIEAMRAPDDTMKDAACAIGPDTNCGQFDYDNATDVWQAMIDAALKP